MTSPLRTKYAIGAFAGLSIITALAGCSSTAASTTDSTDTSNESSSSDGAATTDASYTDGSYTATGDYQSPNGAETIGVELTLKDDVVTEVTITPNASNPNTVRYQGEFKDGIAAEVVGKDIDTLNVTKVAGSSLTSTGFNAAVETIKKDAIS